MYFCKIKYKKNMSDTKLYMAINNRVNKLGITVTELCKEAGVDRSALSRWKSKLPLTLVNYIKIKETIIRLEKENVKTS